MKVKITAMHLESHSLKVPEGLSELLSSGNAWGEKGTIQDNGYDREVVKKDDRLLTILTKRK